MKYQTSSIKFQAAVAGARLIRRGFSLVEVLLAVFILGIGMIMVASVFPVGANWTRQAAETSVGQNVAQDAVSVIKTYYGVNGKLRQFLQPDFVIDNGSGVLIPNLNNSNSVLKARYKLSPNFTVGPFTLQALPGFLQIPPNERAYQFGSSSPFPAPNPSVATYFWTALIRLNPSHYRPLNSTFPGIPNPVDVNAPQTNYIKLASSYQYDLFILVFRKGAEEQAFHFNPPQAPSPFWEIPQLLPSSTTGWYENSSLENVGMSPGTRNVDWANQPTATPAGFKFSPYLMPSVGYSSYGAGTFDPNRTPTVNNANPPMGQYGIGAVSGTVFKQVGDPSVLTASGVTPGGAMPRPPLVGMPAFAVPQEYVICSPAADGTANSASPLVYIYQTTLSF